MEEIVIEPEPSSTKRAFFILVGVLIGTIGVSAYFIFLFPKPDAVVVEKIVEKIVVATTTKSIIPARTYDFRLIRTLDDNGATTTLSLDDALVVDTFRKAIKKDKQWSSSLDDKYNVSYIMVSSSYAITFINPNKGETGYAYIVVDLNNTKITDKFFSKSLNFMDRGTFIFGNDVDGLSYYIYGDSSSVKLLNSNLKSPQTYIEFEGPGIIGGYKIIATTTNSITFGVFDRTAGIIQSGDGDSGYKKVGERTFIIP